MTVQQSSARTTDAGHSSYEQILRATALVGSSTAVSILVGIVRTKAMAMMLGPAGIGLMGALTTIADVARNVAEVGVGTSGVRQIAESAASGEQARVARTAMVLRRTLVALGILGAIALALAARPIASLTFGNTEYAGAVALMSLVVFFRLVSNGQGALLQGLRMIHEQVRINVIGSTAGAAVSIGVVYALGVDGIALGLAAAGAVTLGVSWWHSRKARVLAGSVSVTASEMGREAAGLLRLGMALMLAGCLTAGAAYLVRLILIRHGGLEMAGLYQAAWAVGGLYVTFLLQSLGADFYPRLVAGAKDDALCNRIVNQQSRVSLLLAGFGVVGTLLFAPWAISLLYSSQFAAATETLHWICLGMAMRVITWPLGYILLAKGAGKLFVGVDLLWSVFNVALTWFCVGRLGMAGAGIAFFVSYLLHLCIVYPVVRRLSGFRWEWTTVRAAAGFATVIGAVDLALSTLPYSIAFGLGVVALLLTGAYASIELRRLVRKDRSAPPAAGSGTSAPCEVS